MQEIISRYRGLKGEWTKEDIDRFVSDLSGKEALPTTDRPDLDSLRNLRDDKLSREVGSSGLTQNFEAAQQAIS